MEGHLYLDARDANVTIKGKDSCSFERYKRNSQIKPTTFKSCARFECNNVIRCTRCKRNNQREGQLKLRKIQTKQSNEGTVKFAQDSNKKIQMKEKFNLREI